MKRVFNFVALAAIMLCISLIGGVLHAQDNNFAAAGVSYLAGGSGVSSVAGTGLYARLLSSSAGSYAFTVIDAVPQTVHPFVVGTNIGVGLAQYVFSIGRAAIYVPTAAGVSWSGTNTGWNWSTGAMASIPPKAGSHARILPSVRMVKSSVSGNSGYQVIVGLAFGWGW